MALEGEWKESSAHMVSFALSTWLYFLFFLHFLLQECVLHSLSLSVFVQPQCNNVETIFEELCPKTHLPFCLGDQVAPRKARAAV